VELTAFCVEELVDFGPLVGDGMVACVDCVNDQDNLDRFLAVTEGAKGGDRPTRFVVRQGEVLLLKACNGFAGAICDDGIYGDPAGRRRVRSRRLLCSTGADNKEEGKNRNAQA
jgi:hypothetical protein